MSTNLDLKQTEKASFKLAAYTDGTNDIALGLIMILLGFYNSTRQALGVTLNLVLFLVSLALIVGLQTYLKSRLTPSRVGLVKFGPAARKRLRGAVIVTVVLLILTGLTWYASVKGIALPHPAWIGGFGLDLVFAAVILTIFWSLAYTFQVSRFYFYGALLAVAFLDLIPASLVGAEMQISLALAGLVITVMGAILLACFLRKYPEIREEA